MEVEYCDVVYDSRKYEMNIFLNLDTEDVYRNSLEKIVKRIGIFERRFLHFMPLRVKYGGKFERGDDERSYQYEFDIFCGNSERSKILNVCDLNVNTDLRGVIGTSIDAVFRYEVRSVNEAQDFVMMTELFTRYCFGSFLENSRDYIEKLSDVWPVLMEKLERDDKAFKETLDKIVFDNSTPDDVIAICESIKIVNQ